MFIILVRIIVKRVKKVDIILQTLLFTIPCGLSFLCLMSLVIYTLIKPLLTKKR